MGAKTACLPLPRAHRTQPTAAASNEPLNKPFNAAKSDVLAPEELRRALGAFATGVTVITTLDIHGRPVGLTANSFSSVSLEPALVLWCLSARSANLEAFRAAPAYAINVLRASQLALCRRFADRSVADRFDGVAYRPGHLGAPVLDDCLATFQCVPWQTHAAGDHVLLIGKVVALSQGEGEPLVFSKGKLGAFHPQPALV